jgi:hypothetical protein
VSRLERSLSANSSRSFGGNANAFSRTCAPFFDLTITPFAFGNCNTPCGACRGFQVSRERQWKLSPPRARARHSRAAGYCVIETSLILIPKIISRRKEKIHRGDHREKQFCLQGLELGFLGFLTQSFYVRLFSMTSVPLL